MAGRAGRAFAGSARFSGICRPATFDVRSLHVLVGLQIEKAPHRCGAFFHYMEDHTLLNDEAVGRRQVSVGPIGDVVFAIERLASILGAIDRNP